MQGYVKEYLLELEVRGYSRTTLETTESGLRQFIKVIDVDLEIVKKLHINQFIQSQQQSGKVNNNTINARLKVLRCFFKWCINEDFLDRDPMKGVQLLQPYKPLIKTYDSYDIDKLLNSFKGKSFMTIRNKTIVTLLVETGVRNSELCGIKLNDMTEGSIKIHGKGNKVRHVPISKALQIQLLKYKRVRASYLSRIGQESDYLVISRTGGNLIRQSLYSLLNRIGEDLGIDVQSSVHQYRRYYIQQMVRKTDLYTVQRLVGHTSIKTTEIYLSSIADDRILNEGADKSPLSKKR